METIGVNMPKPRDGESKDDFMERCMGDSEAVEDFPDSDQRYAFCNSQWENRSNKMEKKKIFKPFTIEVKSSDEETREITAIGSQQKVDRDGDVVKVDGVDLKNYKKNPVVLWAHNHSDLPIGKATRVWKEDGKLMFKIKYAEPEEYSFADTVYKLTKGGYINAFSIGFMPDYEAAEYNEKSGGYTFNKSELLEISAVPVPANPLALVQSKSIKKALKDEVIDDTELAEMEFYLKELITDPIEDEVDDIIEKIDDEMKTDENDIDVDQNPEHTTKEIVIKCNSCGHELVCPVCNDIVDKDSSSDPYGWIFKELETESKQDPKEDLIDELLNDLGFNEDNQNG